MTAVQTTQLGSLDGLKGVRIHLTTNNRNLIPDWVEERESSAPATSTELAACPIHQGLGKFIEERRVAVSRLLFSLIGEGFSIVRTNVQKANGDNLRLGITLERHGVSIPNEHISDLMELMREGRWDVRVDRNGPIGRVEYEHIQISCRNRTMRTDSSNLVLGISGEGAIVLF